MTGASIRAACMAARAGLGRGPGRRARGGRARPASGAGRPGRGAASGPDPGDPSSPPPGGVEPAPEASPTPLRKLRPPPGISYLNLVGISDQIQIANAVGRRRAEASTPGGRRTCSGRRRAAPRGRLLWSWLWPGRGLGRCRGLGPGVGLGPGGAPGFQGAAGPAQPPEPPNRALGRTPQFARSPPAGSRVPPQGRCPRARWRWR